MKILTFTQLKTQFERVKKEGSRFLMKQVRYLRKRVLPSTNVPRDRLL